VQDTLLEPLASICGPTELGYNLQLAAAYQKRDLSSSVRLPRLRARVLTQDLADDLRSLSVDPVALRAETLVGETLPSPAGERLAEEILASGAELLGRLDGLDETPTLERRAERLGRRLRSDLDKLTEAIRREVDPDVRRERGLLRRALDGLFHRGVPLERSASFGHFVGRHGLGLLEQLRAAYDPGDPRECQFELNEKDSR